MNVLVIGDLIIDRYTHGTRRGISAETPTIVANLTSEEVFVGGAGLVVRNLLRLGANVTLLTVLGEQTSYHEIAQMFRNSDDPLLSNETWRLDTFPSKEIKGWKTTEKRRFFVEQYKLVQYDIVNEARMTSSQENSFIESFKKIASSHGAIVVCDNQHGVLTEKIAKNVIREAKSKNIPVYVDVQFSQAKPNYSWYHGSSYIFMNEKEFLHARNYTRGATSIEDMATCLDSGIVVKEGEHGASCLAKNDEKGVRVSPGYKVPVKDTCGAGDAFLAAFVHSKDDVDFANRWAALSTMYSGTIVPTKEFLEKVKR